MDAISNTVDSKPSKQSILVHIYISCKTEAFRIEYVIAPETVTKLEAMEKEAVMLVEQKQDTESALEILNKCIEMESKYASAYNNR